MNHPNTDNLAQYRVTLTTDQPYTLPNSTREITVASGGALVVMGSESKVLRTGEMLAISAEEAEAVLLPARHYKPLIVDVYIEAESDDHTAMRRAFYERLAARQRLIEAESE